MFRRKFYRNRALTQSDAVEDRLRLNMPIVFQVDLDSRA